MYAIFDIAPGDGYEPTVFVIESFQDTGGGWCAAKMRSSFFNDGKPIHRAIKKEDINV